jgi:Zn-dependent peptidase ImmA (M78 family)/transcriptional regulator with XRE-family HTH domain
MDPAKLGERLRVARAAAGLTQEHAAEKLGVARTTLVAIEGGDRQPRPEELVALGGLYGVGVHSFLRPSAVRVDLVGQFRRKRTGREGKGDREGVQALTLLHDLAAAYIELERRLHKVTPVDYPPERKPGRGRLDQQAEELAAELRSRLGLGLGPIPDLVGLLELELGLRVFVRALPSSIAGVYAFHDELGACVVLNRVHRRARRRWTLAHELAHFLTSRREPSIAFALVGKHPDDVFADAFAAAFLMPSATLRRIFDEYVGQEGRFSARHLILGAHRLGVSVEAFTRQLERMELLPQGTYDSVKDRGLDEDAVQRVLGSQEECETTEPGARLLMLAAEAHEQGLYSEGQLADMLVMDRVELRRAIDAFTSVDAVDAAIEAHAG